MTELVYVLNDQNQYEESEGVAERIINRSRKDHGGTFPSARNVYAMEDMAEICDRLGRLEESIFWLRKALRDALKIWTDREGTTHIFDKLEVLYGKVGR